MAYQSRSKSATQGKEETAQMDYTHTEAHQMAYDFSVYLHEKMKKFPHYEKFTLHKDIRESIDGILDEIEMFEITKVASHLYAADRLKRRLVRKIRLAYDLGYSAMNKDAYFYCAKQTGAIGAQIGGLIRENNKIWGNRYFALHALIGGGNWNNGVHDGSRAVNANNYPWNVNGNIGVWCVCDL